jgi:protein O-GlcNAc transferase
MFLRVGECVQRTVCCMYTPLHSLQAFRQAVLLHERGQFREAERLYQVILKADKRHFGALCRLGILRLQELQFDEAERLFRRAVKIDQSSADAHQLLGSALTGLGRSREACGSYERAVTLRPTFAEAHNNYGYALQVLGRLDDAMEHYNSAIALRFNYPEAHNNLGNALHLLNRSAEAIASYQRALAIKPDYAEAQWNLGTALRVEGRFKEAVACYEMAITIRPTYHEAYNSLGNTLWAMGRLDEARVQYEKAVCSKPDYAEAHINLADVLAALQGYDAALAACDQAVAACPDDARILTKRGDFLAQLHRDAEALACYEAARVADPGYDLAFDGLARVALWTCDWRRTASLWSDVPAHVAKGRLFNAFNFLGYSGDAALQLACAQRFACHEIPVRQRPLWAGQIWRNRKIKVAYVSCAFHAHPNAYLTVELIEIHDRSRFEVLGFSLGPDDRSEIRARLIRAFDQFYDVRTQSNREIAELINQLQVDIAVDRSGYIIGARPGIFAARPAPIQVNYLGFPGTLGADFYDYILADSTVLPFDRQPFYAERIVHLPYCYQVNDSKRPVAAQAPTRKDAGLPEQRVVFCCFNNSYKITPPIFDIWMRLLSKVEGSVLWLLCDRPAAEINLRQAAAAHDIDPKRLIFARRLPLHEHLARHCLADLFLDTLPYNAHTTAADALWMGLPVVTCCGESFAGRVATSLLRSIGAADLITDSLAAYESLALRLAAAPSLRRELRQRLVKNRFSHPLFNTEQYRQHIEAAYLKMWDFWQQGARPVSFSVDLNPCVSAGRSQRYGAANDLQA